MERSSVIPLFFIALLLFFSGCKTSETGTRNGNRPSAQRPVTIMEPVQFSFLLYLPERYEPTVRTWPLLLFLHGSGERGNRLEKVKKNGPPRLIDEGRPFPFIVVSPQLPEGRRWDPDDLVKLLDELQSRYRVDERRIYVTGLSLGGYGTWKLAGAYPDRIAAIVPVSGAGDPSWVTGVRDLPVWAFHGEKDPAVSVERGRRMVDALREQGNENVRFTVYENTGHNAWSRAYRNKDLYDWLLQQKR